MIAGAFLWQIFKSYYRSLSFPALSLSKGRRVYQNPEYHVSCAFRQAQRDHGCECLA